MRLYIDSMIMCPKLRDIMNGMQFILSLCVTLRGTSRHYHAVRAVFLEEIMQSTMVVFSNLSISNFKEDDNVLQFATAKYILLRS